MGNVLVADDLPGRPRGPWPEKGIDDGGCRGGGCVVRGVAVTLVTVEVLTVEVDGVLRGLGMLSLGIEGGGKRSSV